MMKSLFLISTQVTYPGKTNNGSWRFSHLPILQFTAVPGDNHPCEIYPHQMNMKCSCSRSLPESLSTVCAMQERFITFLPGGAANTDK
jgi:hypothetical protein